MYRLKSAVKNFAWGKVGSDSLVARLKSSDDESYTVQESAPYSEYWFGTHPSGPSEIEVSGSWMPLSEWLKTNPEASGSSESGKQGTIPFLLKVLSVGKALSIQAHPHKSLAETLHATNPKEYPDDNHKPEMAIALTEFDAMCGFRSGEEIAAFLQKVPEFRDLFSDAVVQAFASNPAAQIKTLFSSYLYSDSKQTMAQLERFQKRISSIEGADPIDRLVCTLMHQFPGDSGAFTPFFLNVYHLRPGEGLFLGPDIPHAYLSGDIMEVMACSDNVVRVGLTPKFVDKPTLVNMLTYHLGPVTVLKGVHVDEHFRLYETAADEFMQSGVFTLKSHDTPRIYVVISGKGTARCGPQMQSLSPGRILFISANQEIKFEGTQLMIYGSRSKKEARA